MGDAIQTPLVGIFWSVRDGSGFCLMKDSTPLAEGEQYGDFLTHPGGHYETWEAWRSLGEGGLAQRGLPVAIACHEYEHFPRGRVVYHRPSQQFTVYADRRLQSRAMVRRIVGAFRLALEQCTIKSDEHYQSRRNA